MNDERKELGRIESIVFGFGGYQDAMAGFSVTLCGKGWGVGDFKGTWASSPSEGAKWTPGDQSHHFDTAFRWAMDLLRKARKSHLHELKGVPVEVTFEGNVLASWRILDEVL